jgi:hypothetical protein
MGEELHPPQHPEAPGPGGRHLRVVGGDGGGEEEGVLVLQVLGGVALVDGDAQGFGPFARGQVAPRDLHALRHEEAGQGAHAHPFHAHHVHALHRYSSSQSAILPAAPSGDRRAMASRYGPGFSKILSICSFRASRLASSAAPALA